MTENLVPKIGIIGVGFVGGAVKNYYEKEGYDLFLYDKYKKLGSIDEVNKGGIIFIATPTPYLKNAGFDLSFVEKSIKLLKKSKIIVIKSTILPGSTDYLQKKYPIHKILFNPEFLTEANADKDFSKPYRQILGFTNKSKNVASKIMALLPKSRHSQIIPSTEAELVKYMANTFLALKVVFANQFYDICQTLKLDYDTVKKAVVLDPRIADSHFDVLHAGYRGYGGKCLPKDVNALVQFLDKKGVKASLIKSIQNINRQLLKASNLSESQFL